METMDLEIIREKIKSGWVPSRLFVNPEVYRLEMERLFPRAWQYLGHESEIPEKGDFMTRFMAEDAVIVVRDDDGTIHCLLNSCRHRGMQVCRADRGRATSFTCPYHGWTYNNSGELIAVTAASAAYGEILDRSRLGLHPAAQIDTYAGMIFATWSPEAPPLSDYLGDLRWYLDLMMKRTDGGMKVVGPPQRWDIDANWKIASDNFVGDGYHVLTTHRFAFSLGIAASQRTKDDKGLITENRAPSLHYHISPGNGHGLQIQGLSPDLSGAPYLGSPKELWPQIRRNLTKEQAAILEPATTIHGTIFPNLSFLNAITYPRDGKPGSNYFTLRLWRPKGADKMEIWSWFLVEKTAPEWFQRAAYETYVLEFGAGGTYEQDDTEIWTRITQVNKSPRARQNDLSYAMGSSGLQPDPKWPGPGLAYPVPFCEANQREFMLRCLAYLTRDEPTPAGGPQPTG